MRIAFLFGLVGALLLASVVSPAPVGAQQLVDHIVAVVGEKPIFASDVDRAVAEEIYVRSIRGEPLPRDSAEVDSLRAQFLESLIDRQIVIVKAKKEGIEVTPTEVEDGLDQWLSDLVKSVGSEAALEAELAKEGMTLDGLKARYRKEIEDQLYVSKFMRQQFGAMAIQEADIDRFFKEKYDSIPSVPEVVGIAHIMMSVKSTPAEEEKVHTKVTRALDRLRAGEAFDKVAREMSEDPTTREAGGLIGVVAPADLEGEIASTVRNLAVGQVSTPLRTAQGIEIVKLDGKVGDRLELSHIFFAFMPSAEDSARALKIGDEIRAKLAAGESFESLAKQYSDDAATKDNGGYVGEIETTGLDPSYREALQGLNPGDVSQVIRAPGGYQVLKLISRTASRKPTFDEAKPWIRNLLENRKREGELSSWLAAARQEIYVKRFE